MRESQDVILLSEKRAGKVSQDINQFGTASSQLDIDLSVLDGLDAIIIERDVHVKKGDWRRFPPELGTTNE